MDDIETENLKNKRSRFGCKGHDDDHEYGEEIDLDFGEPQPKRAKHQLLVQLQALNNVTYACTLCVIRTHTHIAIQVHVG